MVRGGEARRVGAAGGDAGAARERGRQRRLLRLGLVLAVVAAWLWYRALTLQPLLPVIEMDPIYVLPIALFGSMIAVTVLPFVAMGRSPHVTYRPEQIDVRLEDVKGLGQVREEVRSTLDLFLSSKTFREEMGGAARRGVLFEGPPGTGKTHMAKAMAAEAGVPFLFVSATAFQSQMYGASARKIRNYFKAIRKAARTEGGAIGFIEEIDAIAQARGGVRRPAAAFSGPADCCGPDAATPHRVEPALRADRMISENVGAIVNEFLVQMQSFDQPTGWQRFQSWIIDVVNGVLPASRQFRRPAPEPVNVLIIAATNWADSLDPAILRPGRFDRRLHFDVPDKAGRREIIDHFLARKAHEEQLAEDEHRDALAGITQRYSPVMIERLLDEALINAVRRGARAMSWRDVEEARLATEVGLGRPVNYTEREQRLIATHEAGHAVMAWLVAPQRRLEILTIIKRDNALGLLAHNDREDVFTRSRTELEHLMQISFGGQAAEEIFFSDVSTGVSGDLNNATSIAVQMVGAAGMSDTLISYGIAGVNGLGPAVLGNSDTRKMVEDLLRKQKERTRQILAANRDLVAALRDALMERHELIGSEITEVLLAAKAARAVPARVGLAIDRVDHGLLGGERAPQAQRAGGYLGPRTPFQQDQTLPPRLR
jgi:ATP-dependent Zn protease